MTRTVALGFQDFEELRELGCFYVDKTGFIKDWWETADKVTLITRPRRFGKTLLLNTVERFFSNRYEDQSRWFEGLAIWEDEKYRDLQGQLPVIFLSFADVKENTFAGAKDRIKELIFRLFLRYSFLLDSDVLSESEKALFRSYTIDMRDSLIAGSLNTLSELLSRHCGHKVIILLDEYDTPMQEAYMGGYWDEITQLMRTLFNSTFKTNPYLDRALMTGITRVSRESMFSDLNNLNVVSTTSPEYETAFGFTEEEVFRAMDEFGYSDTESVKHWYDGFTFGRKSNIYNPWSILNYLKKGVFDTYWANTSGNGLASKLIREGDAQLKKDCEVLLEGGTIHSRIDEQVVFGEIQDQPEAVWSLLLASGYLKVVGREDQDYELALTNYEIVLTFRKLIHRWFGKAQFEYNSFTKALMLCDVDAMNHYMNRVSLSLFSSFDTGRHPSPAEPERFYHGFVLGLIVDLEDSYVIRSNRESGFGRYDVMLEPLDKSRNAYILEFKVLNRRKEDSLEDTLQAALDQIEERQYKAELLDRGIPEEKIHSYSFAFDGKTVLIG